jgi:transposase, IS30 family
MKNLTFIERKKLEKMWNVEKIKSYRALGRILKKHHSTISVEIQRNTYVEQAYCAEEAHNKYLNRQLNKGNKSKIDQNEKLKEFILAGLDKSWSPEQIAARTKKRFKNDQIGCVSHETIYKFIYHEQNRLMGLYKKLRRHRPKRKKWYSRVRRKTNIPQRVSIHERNNFINKRQRFGDWETDSMIFSQQKEIISVQVERKSRLVRIHKCADKSAAETYEALVKTIEGFPQDQVLSITFDNGSENVQHVKLKDIYESIKTYFCDPYCSWQKSTVENTNMFIREYLPRHIKLKNLKDSDIYEIQEKLNNRPRKCLQYLSPNEYYLILKETGKPPF